MRIINQQNSPIITVIACQHGNEYVGQLFYERFMKCADEYPEVQCILANEAALAANARFIDQDLNRSFPGNPKGLHEERLAAKILPHLHVSRHVLDLHTTTSLIKMVPIVTNLDADTRRVIHFCHSLEVALIESPLGNKSLIGQCKAGVSLEYNDVYAETKEAIEDIFTLIKKLVKNERAKPVQRRIYHVSQPIDSSLILPTETQNFVYSTVLNGYPFLFGERSYPNGLLASKISEKMI